LLVKEIIEYCNETDTEGTYLMMDFKKAYDRVSRETMMKTLKVMNFGDGFLGMVETLYADVGARINVNGELTEEVLTGGGVRQGCPLSPYLFICVLELMAVGVRKNKNITGIKEPTSGVEFVISLFADDAVILLGKPREQTSEARMELSRYEASTGSAIHDDKTMLGKVGKTRRERMTSTQLGVSFEIMEDDAVERYLGDMIGNAVTEEERFESCLERMDKAASKWRREDLTMHGRALIVNILLMAAVTYRASVNATSKELRAQIKQRVHEFLWKKKKGDKTYRAEVAWRKLLKEVKEGGVGLRP